MRTQIIIVISLLFTVLAIGQDSSKSLKMISNYSSKNVEVRDILQFEGIEYYQLKFIGKELKSKSYHLTVKEIWDGNIVSDSTIINSADLPFEAVKKVNDTVLDLKIMSKLTSKNKLRMTFMLPRFSVEREFEALETNAYSLRNIAEESKLEIGYGKKFYLMAYILPYEREDGTKSWCEVGADGSDIENWGKKFGIKHYLLFEMKFD